VEQGRAVCHGAPLLRIEEGGVGDNARAAEAAVQSAQNAAAVARRNAERFAILAEAGAVAQRDLDDARSAEAAAQAQLAAARAQSAAVRTQLGNTRPAAPIDGIVSVRSVNPGDVVAPGAALVTVIDPSGMRLEASVPAGNLGEVRVGAPVTFTVSGYPGRTFEGRIRRISPAADPATRQVPILVAIPNSGGALVSGLFAEGRVASDSRRTLAVPDAAVDRRGETPAVTRIRGGRAERVPVRLGARDETGERWEITGGIEPGDTLAIGAARSLTPGTPVQVGGVASPSAPR
jgi:membrane fusion protein, multidrug efflux system